MIRKYLKLAETPTPGPIPPIEDIFACMTPRISGTEPLPRISCLTGAEEGEPAIRIECLWPRLACLLGIREEGAGILSTFSF